MNLSKAERMIATAFRDPLKQRGFSEAKRLTFMRGGGDRVEIISIGARKAAKGPKAGHYCFTAGIGIRFEAIERVRKNKKTPEQQFFPTVGSPLHLLRPERKYQEWCFDELTPPSLEVITDIDQYALPFFDRYETIDDVQKVLASQDPLDWFTLSPAQRIEMLEAISLLQQPVI